MADGLFGGGGAAFGVYPQMGGRRRMQDPQGSADVPLQVLIGRLAGLLGAPAEVSNIVRSPQPMEMFGDVNYDPQTQLPYDTKYFNQRLPLQPTSRAGELAREAGSFVPLNPMPAVRGLGTALSGYGRLAVTESAVAPVLGYHRTTTPFEGEFQNLKNPMGVSFAGNRGFYFSPEINDPTTDIFGKYVIAANVAVKNPAPVYQVNFGMVDGFQTPRSIIQVDKNWLKQNPEAARQGGLAIANSLEDVIAGKTLNRANSFKEYEQQVNQAAKNKKLFVLIDPEKLYAKEVSLLEEKGYDGFNYVRPESATSSMPSQIVAFRPEQINRIASGREDDILKQMGPTSYSDPFVDTIDPSIR